MAARDGFVAHKREDGSCGASDLAFPTTSPYALPMTRAEAETRAAELQAEHPDRDTHRFIARRGADGEWEVAKVALPGARKRQKLTPEVSTEPQPSPADDPRSGHEQRVPGFSGGLG